MKIYKLAGLITLTLLCSACKLQPTPQKIIDQKTRTNYLTKMQTWQTSGKIAIVEKNKHVNVSYTWHQQNEAFKLRFYSPFTVDSVTISGNGQQHRVVSHDSEGDKEIRLEQDLPIAELSWWIKGLPAPHLAIDAVKYDRYNQLQQLRQGGWYVEYQSYHTEHTISLPEKLLLIKDDTKVKLYVRDWE